MSKTHIIYHANCLDGLTAAAVAYTAFEDNADYHAMQYGDKLPDISDGSIVYFVDFSLKLEELKELASRMHAVVVLDHHKTAQKELENVNELYELCSDIEDIKNMPNGSLLAHFDMNKSGAGIAYQFFCGLDRNSPIEDNMVRLVQDRDIWKWEFGEDTRKFNAYLWTVSKTPKAFAEIMRNSSNSTTMKQMLRFGEMLLIGEKLNIESLAKKPFEVTINGIVGIAASAAILQSEVCAKLLKDNPQYSYACCMYAKGDNMHYSLRSEGDFDVSEIAKVFGGGGHRNAAGFTRPRGKVEVRL